MVSARSLVLAALAALTLGCRSDPASPTLADAPGPDAAADTAHVADLPSTPDAPAEAPNRAMIVIHADPKTANPPNWMRLVALLDAAEARGHAVTVLMAADWGDFTTGAHPAYGYDPATACTESPATPCRLEVARDWIAQGHQIGFHHHDCSHAVPDGYFDPQLATHPACQGLDSAGTASDAYAKVKAIETWLGAHGVAITSETGIRVAAQGVNEDTSFDADGDGQPTDPMGDFRSWEWQPENPYATSQVEGYEAPGGTFLNQQRCVSYSPDGGLTSVGVAELGHEQMAVGNFGDRGTLEDLSADLAAMGQAGPGFHLGVVFHAHEYNDEVSGNPTVDSDRAYLDQVFDSMEAAGVLAERASRILEAVGCP